MHPSSVENMQRCLDWYLPDRPLTVVDLGSSNVNGSYRSLLPEHVEYIGLDLEPGDGVDIVLDDPYRLPFEEASIDVVITGQMLEHCEHFWRVFTEIGRVLKQEGLSFVIAPSGGPVHRYPVDCYRFYPDAYQALASWSHLRLVHSWQSECGPWKDLVGVFQKGGSAEKITSPPKASNGTLYNVSPPSIPAEDLMQGERTYLEVLRDIHDIKKPQHYLEIGVRRGGSLSLASCPAIAIDPDPENRDFQESVELYECTSDDFFFFHRDILNGRTIDLAFIDGMHLAEYAFRDFVNLERHMSPSGIIVIDDIFPNTTTQATRERKTRVWTGDVWRFALMLERERPDLRLTWLSTQPTGLLMITALDPKHSRLIEHYNPLLRRLDDGRGEIPPQRILDRVGSVHPSKDFIAGILNP